MIIKLKNLLPKIIIGIYFAVLFSPPLGDIVLDIRTFRLYIYSILNTVAIVYILTDESHNSVLSKIIKDKLNVRETEDLIRGDKNESKKLKHKVKDKNKDPNILDYEKYLSLKLGYKVEIKDKQGTGYLLVRYKNLEQLDAIVELFNS